jgi:SNF2 family DNA or RNA helicase
MNDLIKKPPQKWKPAKFQKRGMKFLLSHACAGLLFKPGLRKTSTTLAAISLLKKQGLVHKVLVIAPKRPCYAVWPGEVAKWEDFKHLKVEILHGKDREKALRRDADIYTITPEGLQWLLGPTVTKDAKNKSYVDVDVRAFKKLGFDLLVVDELQKFKHTTSLRFKTLKTILHTFGRRWGLTGSAGSNGLEDLFGETYVLDMGNALGQYITYFRREFFDQVGPYELVPKLDAEERIYEKLSHLMMHVPSSEIDLPERVENDILIDFDEDYRRIYEEMEALMIAEINGNLVKAGTAGAKSVKCRQICSGGIYLDPEVVKTLSINLKMRKREWINIHDQKTDALEDLIDEMQHRPLLVAYDFHHDVDRLKKRFPKAVFISDVKDKDYTKVEDKWNAGDVPVMFGHPQSIGTGLNLQGCEADLCWHTPTWDQDLYDQFNSRVIRSGNTRKHTMIHRLLMRDTVEDLVMMPTLTEKEGGQQKLFTALLNLAKHRRRAA